MFTIWILSRGKKKVCVFSHVQLFPTPWTVVCQAPLSMEFSRQDYWSRVPFPSLGCLPDSGVEPSSLVSPGLAGGLLTTGTTWEGTNKHRGRKYPTGPEETEQAVRKDPSTPQAPMVGVGRRDPDLRQGWFPR